MTARADRIIYHDATCPLWAYIDRGGRLAAVVDAVTEEAAMMIASGWDPEGAQLLGYRVVPAVVEWTP